MAWDSQYGTDNEDRALGLGVDQAGNTYVAGWTKGVFPGQTGLGPKTFFVRQDALVRKLDIGGSEVWTRQFGTKMPQSAVSVSAGPVYEMFVGGDPPASLPEQSPKASDAGISATSVVSLPEVSAAFTPSPTSSPFGQPATLPVSADPSGGGCSAAPSGKVNAEWLLVALFLPGLMTARIVSKGSSDRERKNSTLGPR